MFNCTAGSNPALTVATGSAYDYSTNVGLLPQGLYIEVYYDSNGNEVNRAKVYRY